MTKPDREIMEMLAAFDLTRCPWSAAKLRGADPKTVQRYVDKRDAGASPFEPSRRARLIDPYLEKIEELVERSHGHVRADVVHDDHIVPMGFAGDERTTRRAGGGRQGGVVVGTAPHLSAVGPRARDVGPVRLGQGPRGRRPRGPACSAPGWRGAASGWSSRPGTGPCHDDGLHRRHPAPHRRRAHLPAHRQRADRDHRPGGGPGRAPPGDGLRRPATTAWRWRPASPTTPRPTRSRVSKNSDAANSGAATAFVWDSRGAHRRTA